MTKASNHSEAFAVYILIWEGWISYMMLRNLL
jgi:hypothetical protein